MVIAFNEPRFAIEPAGDRCTSCSEEVAVEAPFYSAVFFEGEVFRRRTYCTVCSGDPPQALAEAYAFWRSRRAPPQAAPRKIRFDPELLLEFFRRLGLGPPAAAGSAASPEGAAAVTSEGAVTPEGAAETPQGGADAPRAAGGEGEKTRLRLVLALLLWRRKHLVLESTGSRDGSEWLKFAEKSDRSRTHLVENPTLSDAELEAVKTSLAELLQMDL